MMRWGTRRLGHQSFKPKTKTTMTHPQLLNPSFKPLIFTRKTPPITLSIRTDRTGPQLVVTLSKSLMDSLGLSHGDHLGVAESINPTEKQLMFYPTDESPSSRKLTKTKLCGVVRYPCEAFSRMLTPTPGRRCVPKVEHQNEKSVTISLSGIIWSVRKEKKQAS